VTTEHIDRLFRLDGRVAIVTGAGSGLGRRFAQILDAAGAQLVIAGRRQQPLQDLVDELDGRPIALPCDLSSDASVEAFVDEVRQRFEHIDVLVNNAGATQTGAALDEPMDGFREILGVDLSGTFLLAREVARHMIDAGGGSIVNVASIAGVVGTGAIPMASYAAAKGGLISLTRELAAQWGRHGVRVNTLSPGWFGAGMGAWANDDEHGRTWLEKRTPLKRIGRPDELDGALLFLATDASTFMTGQDLAVDGGWTII
jgi:NAD(P)-dependent dehydrogenase (short-subunit alcohol dehydrogenase family)